MPGQKLTAKVALITGAARGIGRSVAYAFAREGAQVVVSDVDFLEVKKVAQAIGSFGQALPVQLDVAATDSIREAFSQLRREWGVLDILVNNAGIQPPNQDFSSMPVETWDGTFTVNLRGMFLTSQAAIPFFKERGQGTIINTGSIAGLVHWKRNLSYLVSKAGVATFTKGLALELAEDKIRVNAIAPGHVDTELNKDLFTRRSSREEVARGVPLGRIATPDDLSGAYVFLASEAASYITGHVLVVDGNYSLL